jgi:ArsR family transcriptional regulator
MSSIFHLMRLLSEPTRLRLILLLRDEELTVAELQEILSMKQSRISTSLAQLRRQGIVTDRRVGKNSYYTGVASLLKPLAEILKRVEQELPEADHDKLALKLTLCRRRDLAADYFEKLAGKFGHAYVPGRSWQALAHGLLRLLPPLVIADLGAGEGTLFQLLARSAKKVVAIDNHPKMVAFGKKIAKKNRFTNLEYRLGDMEAPPIAKSSVDIALFSQALHHAISAQRAVDAAFNILKPGGKIVILDLLSHTYEQAKELYADVWLGFSSVELHTLLTKAGFKNLEIQVVDREEQAPHFQTILATGEKPK